MTENPKKQGYLGRIVRFFTQPGKDAYAAIPFREPEQAGDEVWPALESPSAWSPESAALLAEGAINRTSPGRLRAVEENTVPSWLWRHIGEGNARVEEFSARHIFDRVVGSATYRGWKQKLFSDESDTHAFFDEMRFLLMQRHVALEPGFLKNPGLDWAYGLDGATETGTQVVVNPGTDIPNTTIDTIVRGVANKNTRAKWQKLWTTRPDRSSLKLNLSNIAADWEATDDNTSVRAILDLMAFRYNEGWVNIEALRHAVRLTVILLDMHEDYAGQQIGIGFCNLASLLVALALPYDSDNARSVAAAISAIITAEAYAASAELAGLRGPGADYIANREIIGRILRNHRRAAYGDRSDYEKVSVLPVPLTLEHSPDLALVAVAQRRWEDVLALVRQHGLRHTQVTSLVSSSTLAMFMESRSQGISPLPSLTVMRPTDAGTYRQEIDTSIPEALERLGYEQSASHDIIRHIAGTGTLEKAPGVNHVALREQGFDEEALQRVEDYLANIDDIRLAFTRWILGDDFCQKALKISAAKLQNPRFDLLRHLGFTPADIEAANAWCYGHKTIQGAKGIRQAHSSIFATGKNVSLEARIRMAAAVQGFISGDAELLLPISSATIAAKGETLLLTAWRQGVKSLTLVYDESIAAKKPAAEISDAQAKRTGEKIRRAAFVHTKQPGILPKRSLRLKAGSDLVSYGRGKTKPSSSTRGKRG